MSGIIDYNMPLTSTYLKQMKLRVMNSQEQVRCLLSPSDQEADLYWLWLRPSRTWGPQ